MPPRKSTSSRQSDVSTARFALMEDAMPVEPTPSPAAPVVEVSTSEPPSEKKQDSHKSKESEKKKKEEHDEPITIEVRMCRNEPHPGFNETDLPW